MKKLLNTLYVTTQGAYLHQEGEAVVVKVESQEKLRLPIHTLGGIVCFGNVLCSPFLLGLCGERGVGVSYLTEHGRFMSRMQGPVSGNILLRKEQYRKAQTPNEACEVARNLLTGKLTNMRTVLRRAVRDHPESDKDNAMAQASDRLDYMINKIGQTDDIDALRGLEGDTARSYFALFDRMITADKESFYMRERSRRPPLDNLNALLSFLYTLLTHDAVGACEGVGLDPQMGFLHAMRPGRPSLALDLMEEFRSVIADRLALSLINLRQINGKGFKTTETGAVVMDDETRKTVLVSYQKRKQEEIMHPYLQEKAPVGLLLHLQALFLARHLRGDIDGYPPFFWR
ncbi:type I-C CRISPR-associated endonuclease Cas1 [candidate division TA06 bacterium]|uniref:CRISPR-associated endonuclease Cas1 n=1 Tax=candidate division TA06 bacterium TaxID=2250710 RepID=A0A933IF26_UNCT6|nr:type I-C CRISPR-associated endonuclease Cas1 [candidate division TA06 bacterium]